MYNILFRQIQSKFLSKFSITQTRTYILDWSPNTKTNKTTYDKFLCLPVPECKCQVEYVWIDGTGENLRSKARTLDFVPACSQEVPHWAYDGSSCFQASGVNSDVYLIPAAMYKDPFRRGNHRIVLCETYDHEHKPTATNHRCACNEAMQKAADFEPQFGIEQEYQLMDMDGRPFGWPVMRGEPTPHGMYYCGVGAGNAYGRDIVESHYRACLYSGVMHCGVNAEVTAAQWEFQVGVCDGIKAADDTWMARFLLYRIAEEFGVGVSLHPKLFPNWNGAGCHTNFSTKQMRDEGGITAIEEAICKLSKKHKEHLKRYDPHGGKDNRLRLTGQHETSSMEDFTHAIAHRGVSVRIGREVADKKRGFLEDRRPASNCDPYSVTDALVRTCLLDQ